MKALGEIGILKGAKFIFYSLFSSFLNSTLIFPFRSYLLRLAGAQIGRNSVIHKSSYINHYQGGFRNLYIGNECFIGEDTSLDLYGKIVLGDQVTISHRVIILTHTNVGYKNHPLQKFFPKTVKNVELGKGCFIGAGSIILPGVTVGSNSMIGAGSVATKDIPSQVVVAGVPAKIIKRLV